MNSTALSMELLSICSVEPGRNLGSTLSLINPVYIFTTYFLRKGSTLSRNLLHGFPPLKCPVKYSVQRLLSSNRVTYKHIIYTVYIYIYISSLSQWFMK